MKNKIVSPEVLILGGIPASGKSTFRAEFLRENSDYVAVSRDDFRYMLRNVGWEPAIEPMVTQLVNQTIINAVQNGRSVIVDATHCTEKAINGYSFLKDLYPVKLRYKFIEIDLETAVERDSLRERSVGRVVIEKMFNDLQAFKESVRYKQIMSPDKADPVFAPVVQDKRLPPAVIFDIDGTLARMKTRGRRPYDWHRVGEDLPVYEVIDVLKMYAKRGYYIIIMSGRDGVCRPETEKWLADYDICYDEFHMRPAGNMEKDSIIKHRLFTENVLPKYYTEVVYDDRNQVVTTWRQMGLTCFQVAEGDF